MGSARLPAGGPVRVIGSYLSPYVRKVLVCLELKGIEYEVDPIVPFFGGDRFTALSPLRRVPVLIDGDVVLADSTVVCEYLEERTPEPPLLPAGAAARARARWLETRCAGRTQRGSSPASTRPRPSRASAPTRSA